MNSGWKAFAASGQSAGATGLGTEGDFVRAKTDAPGHLELDGKRAPAA